MSKIVKNSLCIVVILLGITIGVEAQTIRIMPLGNSITWDENSLDKTYPRSDGVRISYRYRLYQLMHDEGWDFDYVGSEDCGNNYFFNPELDDNAGFPGIETWQLTNLINTGYNGVTGTYEAPGPYLQYHPADIILLHIGTNALITSANEVDALLDRIRAYDSDVLILVARIINRRTYHGPTTTFNNNVELMVTGRSDPRIKMVNLESGAGINYSIDMIDNLHPNQAGYDKMAFKWFDALKSLNGTPAVTQIDEQFSTRGNSFAPISLDNYVVDNEDDPQLMTWTFTRKLGSQLIVNIDANRTLTVSPNGDWYGSELLTLKAEDTGSGAFPASSSIQVRFTVAKGNDAPIFESNPTTIINQDEAYVYTVQAFDLDGDSITYEAIQKPSWMSFDDVTHKLTGTPQNSHVGFHDITLRLSDPSEYRDQSFQLEVVNVNDAPQFVSVPETEVDQGTLYSYVITALDPDGDPLEYTIVSMPNWLQFNAGSRVISGTPGFEHVGDHQIIIRASDGTLNASQNFQVTVIDTNDPPTFISTAITQVFQDGNYYYNVVATDIDGDALTYSAPQIPDWLSFDPFNRTLIGNPDNDQVGNYDVVIRVTDGHVETDQNFVLNVVNVNDQPFFITEPLTIANAFESYVYVIYADDIDPLDQLTFGTVVIPPWLTLVSGSKDALLFGTPTKDEIGSHAIILSVSDGMEEKLQGFTLKVMGPNSVDDLAADDQISVYPNPAREVINFRFVVPDEVSLEIYNAAGRLLKSIPSENKELLEVNVSDFERGIYFYKANINGTEKTGRFIKN